MKWRLTGLIAVCVSLGFSATAASTLYVDLNSTNPVSPYAGWTTAATNIQDAITAAVTGDMVVVTDGVYSVGGRITSILDTTSNRIYINKAITVESVNGPWSTTIMGGLNLRPAWLTNGASLIGFTLTNGVVVNANNGGGVWCWSSNAVVANCVIVSNSTTGLGSGVYQGTCNNCFINRNCLQESGASVFNACLNNCTITANVNLFGISIGGVANCNLTNCIIRNNTRANYSNCKLVYCCTTPAATGIGNFTNDPGLYADGIHLTSGSPCIGAGTNVASFGTDIFGNSWSNPPSVGCAEWQPAPYVPKPQLQYTNQPIGFSIGDPAINGAGPISAWWLKDGAPLQDDGHFNFTQTTNLVVTGVNFPDTGNYQLVASNTFGTVTSAVAQVVIHAVDISSTNPVSPYSSLSTAATNIQDAIDAASAGEIILVEDGTYNAGGRLISGTSNRVALYKPVTVASVNGYAHTIIQGAWDAVSTNGPAAIRCVYLTNNATLKGFTLENGATPSGVIYPFDVSDSGGGIFCVSSNAIVANCFLTNNSSIFGGGICNGTLNNSFVGGNFAICGGGACLTTLNNCTVAGNGCVTPNPNAGYGGGAYDCTMRNSIVLNNYNDWMGIAASSDDYQNFNYPLDPYQQSSHPLTNCCSCTDPLPSGTGNIDGYSANPQFLDLYHIASTSPCRGAGSGLYANGTDLDSEQWANPPSMGCDEVVVSNLAGPLSVTMSVSLMGGSTNLLVSTPGFLPPQHYGYFEGNIVGRAAYVAWSFGDGPNITSLGVSSSHYWTNTGDYTVTFTAYNSDNPGGVATDTIVHVVEPDAPQLQPTITLTNGFHFQFFGQTNANYTIQFTTNLTPPVAWQTLGTIYWNFNNLIQVNDPVGTNAARFYRVLAQ